MMFVGRSIEPLLPYSLRPYELSNELRRGIIWLLLGVLLNVSWLGQLGAGGTSYRGGGACLRPQCSRGSIRVMVRKEGLVSFLSVFAVLEGRC